MRLRSADRSSPCSAASVSIARSARSARPWSRVSSGELPWNGAPADTAARHAASRTEISIPSAASCSAASVNTRQQSEPLGDDALERPLRQHGPDQMAHRLQRDLMAHLGTCRGQRSGTISAIRSAGMQRPGSQWTRDENADEELNPCPGGRRGFDVRKDARKCDKRRDAKNVV